MTDSRQHHPADDWTTQSFTGSGGIQLVADVGGDPIARAVIFLHGGGQTRHSWRDSMSALIAQGYHVINLDARGHGDSDWASDGDYSLDVMAADLARIAATLASPPALVGASMGGAAALCFAGSQVPSASASALVVVDLVPRIDPIGTAKIQAFMSAHPQGFSNLEEVVACVAAYNPNRPPPRDPAGLMRNLRERDGRMYWHWDPRFLTGSGGTEYAAFADRLNQAATQVRIPTLLVRGLRSELVTDQGVKDFKARVPHLEIFNVAEAGHMLVGDKNDVFNEGILRFLRKQLPPA